MDMHGIPPSGHSPQVNPADQMIQKKDRAYIERLERRPHYQEVIRNVLVDGRKEDLSDIIAYFKEGAIPIPQKMKLAIESAFVDQVGSHGVKHAGQAHAAAAAAPRTDKQQVEHLSKKEEVTDQERKKKFLDLLQKIPGGSRYRDRDPDDFRMEVESDLLGTLKLTIHDKLKPGFRGIVEIKQIAVVAMEQLSFVYGPF